MELKADKYEAELTELAQGFWILQTSDKCNPIGDKTNVERSNELSINGFMQSYEIVKLQESRSLIKW